MTKTEYRISWVMWPHAYPEPIPTSRITDDEESARDQYEGLKSMEADHEIRPCDEHVWDPKLEVRITETYEGNWRIVQ